MIATSRTFRATYSRIRPNCWAELNTLSYRLRLAYSITHIRDRYLAIIRSCCFWFMVASLLFIMVAIYFQQSRSDSSPVINFLIVGVVGLTGALTSISRRSQQIVASSPMEDDPVIQASGLQQGAASLVVAALTGPVFALILLVIFMGGALQIGDLTPTFSSRPQRRGVPGPRRENRRLSRVSV